MNRLWPLGFLAMTACVPLPFAIPPTKVEAGAAVRLGDDEAGSATFPIRFGVPLLQVFEERHRRSYDFAPGWGVYPTSSGVFAHGPYFEAGWLQPINFDEDGSGWRWGVHGKGHYLFAQEVGSGFGMTLQATIEWSGFVAEPFAECTVNSSSDPYAPEPESKDSCAIGLSAGEGGIGIFAETSYASVGGLDLGWVGGGLLFRIPASIGILLVPLWD